MDAAQVVDLGDVAVALAGRDRVVGRVVGAAHVDAAGRAHARAQLAADALLHAVLVAVEDVATVEADGLDPLTPGRVLGVVAGQPLLEQLLEGDPETVEVAHQMKASSSSRSAMRRRWA